MSARAVMRHRTTINRNQSPDDDWGEQAAPGWNEHLTGLPCHAWFNAGRMVIEPAAGVDAVVKDLRLIVPSGTDVTVRDQVGPVLDKRGGTILPGPFEIDDIGIRADHQLLFLKEVG